ncbi:MAG: adenylate kinase [Gemmatimonadaceae bacterium]|nr:adenylate kinase [Gemmatimonadaceae bacterium]
MNIVLLGPPGAGKGTQGERVAQRLGIPKLATGDVLRAAVREGTEQGLKAKGYMERGDLVPDAVILGIMKEALARPEAAKGVVLDGVVRTVPQAEGLERVLGDLGRRLDAVLMFDVDEDELVRRLSSRTVCEACQTPYTGREPGASCEKCGGRLVRRKDDEPEAVRNRMRAYREQTAPVIDWYQRKAAAGGNAPRFIRIDAEGPIDEVTERVMRQLKEQA